jgi:HEAT repeat protein
MYRNRYFALCTLCLIAVSLLLSCPASAGSLPAPSPPDPAHRQAADALLQQIWNAQPGQPKFDAIDAVVREYKASDATTQNAITWLCLTYMKDTSRAALDRWPCCYVLSGVRYEPAVPDLINVLLYDNLEDMRVVAAEALGSWYKDTARTDIREALVQASRDDTSKRVRDVAAKYLNQVVVAPVTPVTPVTPVAPVAPVPNPPDDAHRKAADALLQQIWNAQPGQPKFDAIDAVVREYKASDAATQNAITWLCLTYMKDTSRAVLDRWPCCYVLSGVRYEPAVPDLINVLLYDGQEDMRAVAAEALGGWYTDTANAIIREALVQASRKDTSKRVRDVAAKYLNLVVVAPVTPVTPVAPVAPVPNPPDDAHRKAADALLQQIWNAQPGQPKFDAIDAVVLEYKKSDAATQNAITWLCLTYMKDTSRGPLDRWPCCYVIGRSGYMQGVPDMIDVLLRDEIEAMRAVAAEALGGIYKATRNATIHDALLQAARTDTSKWVRDTIAKYLGNEVIDPVPNPPDDKHRKAADALLQQIWNAKPGQPKFDAIDAVVREYKKSDAVTRNAITWLCLTYMKDTSRGPLDRWPCCYVIGRGGYMQGVPDMIDTLLHDQIEAMRAVAAEALGGMYKKDTRNATIHDALLQAARTDTSKRVRDVIAKYLGKDMPAG